MTAREIVENAIEENVEQLKIYRDRLRELSPEELGHTSYRDSYERRMHEILKAFEVLNYAIIGADEQIAKRLHSLVKGWQKRAEIQTILIGVLARIEGQNDETQDLVL